MGCLRGLNSPRVSELIHSFMFCLSQCIILPPSLKRLLPALGKLLRAPDTFGFPIQSPMSLGHLTMLANPMRRTSSGYLGVGWAVSFWG